MKRKLLTDGLPLALIAAAAVLQASVRSGSFSPTHLSSPPAPYWGEYINVGVVKRMLGLRVLAADLVWIDLMYKADVQRSGDFSPFYRVMGTIKELDPGNYLALWVGGLYLSVIKDDIGGASKLFREAVAGLEADQWVDGSLRGSIYFAYAYHLLYEEKDTASAARYMAMAASTEGATPLSKEMAKTLSSERGRIEVGFRVLNDFHRRASTPDEKRRIEEKMTKLLHEKELLDLNDGFDDYIVRTKAASMPREKVFRIFLRSINHRGVDLFGARLKLDDGGRIASGGGADEARSGH